MPSLNILIKPASSECNLKCKYCFYHSLAEKREVRSYGMMSENTLEEIVKKAFEFADGVCSFGFQGGEPTLMGVDFYKLFIELIRKYNKSGIKVIKSIQTNGMLIDLEWAKFLVENDFLVGLSIDGFKDLHDYNRVDSNSKGSFNRVMATVKLFEEYKVEYNILQVLTANSARYASKIFNFFKKQNFKHLQFIPCLDPLGESLGSEKYSLTKDKYLEFLKKYFDLWYLEATKGNLISIRHFDNILGIMLNQEPESCDMRLGCMTQNIIEADGSVYPCDFYVIDQWKIGNINDKTFNELIYNDNVKKFLLDSYNTSSTCKQCEWFSLCRGGCKRHRDDNEDMNYYCQVYKEFFEYSVKRFYKIAQDIRNGKYIG